MRRSIVGAVAGMLGGSLLAILLFWSGPWIVQWLKSGPRLEVEAWVFYVVVISGAGFGAATGALIGSAAALEAALRRRD